MFGKSQARILSRYYEQTLSNFSITLQSLQASIDHIISHQLPSSVSLLSNIRKHFFFLSPLVQKLFFDSSTDSCSFLLKKYLIVVNRSNITLSLNHFIMYVCCWRRNQRDRNKLLCSTKTFLLLLTKSHKARKFCFSLCFMSFYRFFSFSFSGLPRPLSQIFRVRLTQTPQEVLTKSP